MAAAARADGIALTVNSAFRSDAEQARLYAQHPDPRWVAPPGQSLHRNATELDLGPPAAYGWLASNASRFHFTQRYSWEPWHYELSLALFQPGLRFEQESSSAPLPRRRRCRKSRNAGAGRSGRFVAPARAAGRPAGARGSQGRWNTT